MVETLIKLNTFDDVKQFVDMTSRCTGDIFVCSDKHIVDGRSIMGLLSLDFSQILKVEFHGDIPKDVRDNMQKYIVE